MCIRDRVCTYAIALSNELQLPNVIPMLVYYNKDTSRIKTVEIPFSFMDEAQQYWEDTRDIIDELGDDFNEIDANSMVGVPFSDWECGYCEFKDKCHG
jgi:Fe-S-cluster formation regulator IscX/YfhJ